MSQERLKLAPGLEYKVELYPGKEIVDAVYIGNSRGHHVLSVCQETPDMDGYLLVDDHWMCLNEKGQVTHKPISSMSIGYIPREIPQTEENSFFLKILRESGVVI